MNLFIFLKVTSGFITPDFTDYLKNTKSTEKNYNVWFWNKLDKNNFEKCDSRRNINFGYISSSLFLCYSIYIIILLLLFKPLIS